MKYMIFAAALAAAIYFGYRRFGTPSRAALIYVKFAEARAYGRFAEARDLAIGDALAELDSYEVAQKSNVGLPFARVSAAQVTREIAGPIAGVKHNLESESRTVDGSVSLVATYEVCRDRPGCAGLRCTECKPYHHTVEVCPDGSEWKVCSFSEE